MDRRTITRVAAAAGCVMLLVSAHVSWFDGRAAYELPVMALVQADIPLANANSYWSSVATPLECAALFGLLGMALNSRAVIGFGSTVVGLTLLMWHLMRLVPSLAGDSSAGNSQFGVTLALIGLIPLVGATVSIGSRRTEIHRPLSVFGDEPR